MFKTFTNTFQIKNTRSYSNFFDIKNLNMYGGTIYFNCNCKFICEYQNNIESSENKKNNDNNFPCEKFKNSKSKTETENLTRKSSQDFFDFDDLDDF